MKRAAAVVLVAIVTLAGAQAAESPTAKAWMRLYHMQHAGQVLDNWDVRGDSHAPQLAKLEAWAERKGIMFAEARTLEQKDVVGLAQSTRLGWIVLIDPNQTANARFYTLLHELAHVFTPQRFYVDGTIAEREVFAELVAVQVADGAGLDVWAQTATYIGTKADTDAQARMIQSWAVEADRVVVELAGALDVAGKRR